MGKQSNTTVTELNYFNHPQSLVDKGAIIGDRTKIWAFAHILPDARIGTDCNVCDHVFIENNVVVGDRVTIKCGVQLWSGLRVGDDVFIGPNASFSNDNFPRSGQHLAKHPETILEQGCSIGANATILPGLRIGRSAMVGAGAVVTRSVPPNAIVAGNPAQILGYASAEKRAVTRTSTNPSTSQKAVASLVQGVTFHQFPVIQDLRGDLTVAEYPRDVPFEPKRHFLVFNVQNREIRGEHAHRRCAQFLICVAGSCHVVADDGTNREEYVLQGPTQGLFLPPMTWATQYKYSSDGVLLVLASEHYDSSDYIRDYDAFLKMVSESKPQQ